MTSNRVDTLDTAAILRMAMAHLARYSASSAGLRSVLIRKARRWHDKRGVERPDDAIVAAQLDEIVEKLTQSGLLDDAEFARSRARRLVQKGLPRARIRQDFRDKGLVFEGIDEAVIGDEDAQARRFAERKRLGPFRSGPRAPYRLKDIRALTRAGFAPRTAVSLINGGLDAQDRDDDETDPMNDV